MSKIEINASRENLNLRLTAEGSVAMVITVALVVMAIGGCAYFLFW